MERLDCEDRDGHQPACSRLAAESEGDAALEWDEEKRRCALAHATAAEGGFDALPPGEGAAVTALAAGGGDAGQPEDPAPARPPQLQCIEGPGDPEIPRPPGRRVLVVVICSTRSNKL